MAPASHLSLAHTSAIGLAESGGTAPAMPEESREESGILPHQVCLRRAAVVVACTLSLLTGALLASMPKGQGALNLLVVLRDTDSRNERLGSRGGPWGLQPVLLQQIRGDLAPWRESGVSLRMVEQAYCNSHEDGFRLQVGLLLLLLHLACTCGRAAASRPHPAPAALGVCLLPRSGRFCTDAPLAVSSCSRAHGPRGFAPALAAGHWRQALHIGADQLLGHAALGHNSHAE